MSDLTTSGIYGNLDSSYGIQESTDGDTTLGKDAFLQLLVTQLQYQDPTNPMDDTEMVTQLAQFSELEEMENLNTEVRQANANSMIGKFASQTSYNVTTGEFDIVAGYVAGTRIDGDDIYLVLESGTEINYEDVENTYTDSTINSQLSNIQNSINMAQNMNLIGQSVQCYTYNDDGYVDGYEEGTVDSIKFKDGLATLMIDNKEVPAAGIISISPTDSTIIGKNVTFGGEEFPITEVSVSQDEEDYTIEVNLTINGSLYPVNHIEDLPTAFENVGNTIDIEGESKDIVGLTLVEGDIYLIDSDGGQYLYDDLI